MATSEKMDSEKPSDKSWNDKPCCFCNSREINELRFGGFHNLEEITVHYYCLLLSSNVEQNGADEEGILGFLPADIRKEIIRGRRLSCVYCRRKGATLGCCNRKCRVVFHLPCGITRGSLHQFFGQFRSFCKDHRPRQKVDAIILANAQKEVANCPICMENITPRPDNNVLWAPCCKKSSFFHRDCVQHMALSAGYFFRCPLCNEKNIFSNTMREHGIYIPERDASWEMEPNAFQELYYRPDKCCAPTCKCPRGVEYSAKTRDYTKWSIVVCEQCGGQGIHIHCGNLKLKNPLWKCNVCLEFEANNATENGNNATVVEEMDNDEELDVGVEETPSVENEEDEEDEEEEDSDLDEDNDKDQEEENNEKVDSEEDEPEIVATVVSSPAKPRGFGMHHNVRRKPIRLVAPMMRDAPGPSFTQPQQYGGAVVTPTRIVGTAAPTVRIPAAAASVRIPAAAATGEVVELSSDEEDCTTSTTADTQKQTEQPSSKGETPKPLTSFKSIMVTMDGSHVEVFRINNNPSQSQDIVAVVGDVNVAAPQSVAEPVVSFSTVTTATPSVTTPSTLRKVQSASGEFKGYALNSGNNFTMVRADNAALCPVSLAGLISHRPDLSITSEVRPVQNNSSGIQQLTSLAPGMKPVLGNTTQVFNFGSQGPQLINIGRQGFIPIQNISHLTTPLRPQTMQNNTTITGAKPFNLSSFSSIPTNLGHLSNSGVNVTPLNTQPLTMSHLNNNSTNIRFISNNVGQLNHQQGDGFTQLTSINQRNQGVNMGELLTNTIERQLNSKPQVSIELTSNLPPCVVTNISQEREEYSIKIEQVIGSYSDFTNAPSTMTSSVGVSLLPVLPIDSNSTHTPDTVCSTTGTVSAATATTSSSAAITSSSAATTSSSAATTSGSANCPSAAADVSHRPYRRSTKPTATAASTEANSSGGGSYNNRLTQPDTTITSTSNVDSKCSVKSNDASYCSRKKFLQKWVQYNSKRSAEETADKPLLLTPRPDGKTRRKSSKQTTGTDKFKQLSLTAFFKTDKEKPVEKSPQKTAGKQPLGKVLTEIDSNTLPLHGSVPKKRRRKRKLSSTEISEIVNNMCVPLEKMPNLKSPSPIKNTSPETSTMPILAQQVYKTRLQRKRMSS